jgi:hypothetical protein
MIRSLEVSYVDTRITGQGYFVVGLPQVKDDSVFLIFASMKNNLEQ